MKTLINYACEDGIVVFVGAGISMLPPTSLPNWFQLNHMTLSSLGQRIGEYIQSPAHVENLIGDLIHRRDQTDTFAPDYQAQLMVEECGQEYFKVLTAMDTNVINPCHDAIAQLARAGILKAILTTNFDRLCEVALDKWEVSYQVFSDLPDFKSLKTLLKKKSKKKLLPVIKIHGTIDKVDTLVDTLQQRIQGRGEDLPVILDHLQQRYHWLFIGYSGSDFDYNPNYLSIRSGADRGKGFTFLTRSGEEPRSSVKDLIAAYGNRAGNLKGELPGWLLRFLKKLDATAAKPTIGGKTSAAHDSVKARIDEWAASLDMMQVISILSALLSGADANISAYKLLRLVWRHYRTSADSASKSYGRFCYRFGTSLLEHGVTPDENWEGAYRSTISVGGGNFLNDDAFQFLARAKKYFDVTEATPNLAIALAYRGDLRNADAALSESLKYAADIESSQVWADAVNAAAVIRYFQKDWSSGTAILASSFNIIGRDGDEIRRARYYAWFGAYLAWYRQMDRAEEVINKGIDISRKLGLAVTEADNIWANGVLETEKKDAAKAFNLFSRAWKIYEKNVLRPRLLLTYLEAARSIMLPNTDAAFNEWAVDRFFAMQKTVDELLEHKFLFGFLPVYSLTNYYFFWNRAVRVKKRGEKDLKGELFLKAKHSLSDAKRSGEITRNSRILEIVEAEEPDVNSALSSLGLS